MPDGDVVYHGVGRGFQSAYQQLCEGYFDEEHVAANIAKALRKQVKRYGNQPIALIGQTCSGLSASVASGSPIEYGEASRQIDDVARYLMGHRRGTPLAMEACKEYLLEMNAGAITEVMPTDVLRNYVSRVLLADFWEHLPLLNYHNGVEPEVIEERLERVRPYVEAEIEFMASQIAKTGKVDRLRKLSHAPASTPPDFESIDVSLANSWWEVSHASN